MARETTNIKRRGYRVLFRTPAGDALTIPGDAGAFATFLGTFTEAGYSEKDTMELTGEQGDTVTLDDSNVLRLGTNLAAAAKLLQTGSSDITALLALDNTNQDVMFYAENSNPGHVHVIKDVPVQLFPVVGNNEVDGFQLNVAKDNAESLAAVYVQYPEPV